MSAKNIIMAAAGAAAQPGQKQWTYATDGGGIISWTVPAGVTSVCILCVQAGERNGIGGGSTQEDCYVMNASATVLCRANYASGNIGTAGFVGGAGGTSGSSWGGGGGGAAGYASNGGNGGNIGGGSRTNGTSGSGSGGDAVLYTSGNLAIAQGGGGVGLLGQGSTNAYAGGGGSGGADAVSGSNDGALYGGGFPGIVLAIGPLQYSQGGRGGNLAYANNVAVTPGTALSIYYADSGVSNNAAVRIIWGFGRAFPSTNTGNV